MKVTRQMRGMINQRSYAIAIAAMKRWAAQMHDAIERDELQPDEITAWWPAEIQPGGAAPAWGEGVGSRRLVSVGPADVCGNCDCEMPEGCGGRFRGDMSCELRKRGLWSEDRGAPLTGMEPPYRKPGETDPGFDATDHLAGF